MARLKQMVKKSVVEVAKAKRKCKFTGQSITKGTVCMVVHGGPRDRACYSQKIALDMIRQARTYLMDLETQLSRQASS